MINYSKQSISKRYFSSNKVLKSNFLTQGPMVTKFENEIKKITKANLQSQIQLLAHSPVVSCVRS